MATRHANAFQRGPHGFFKRSPHGYRDAPVTPPFVIVIFQDEASDGYHSGGPLLQQIAMWEAICDDYPVRMWVVHLRQEDGSLETILDFYGLVEFPGTYVEETVSPRPLTGLPSHISGGMDTFFERFARAFGAGGANVRRVEVWVDNSGSMTNEDVGSTPLAIVQEMVRRSQTLRSTDTLIGEFTHEQWLAVGLNQARAFYGIPSP